MEKPSARNFVKDGIWFHDTQGRFVLFRGTNLASRSKLPPYLPISPLQSKSITSEELKEELKVVEPEIKRLKELGFNVVRLLVMWKAIEPTPNPNLDHLLPEGENYLNLVKEIIDEFYSYGLFVIIDFHEDIAHWTVYPATDTALELQFLFIQDPQQIHTWLPQDSKFIEQYKSQGIFSFHYYDPWTISYGLFNLPDNMHNKQKEWPKIFHELREAAISRGLIPFLTEFGGSQDWENLYTDIQPTETYQAKQIRAYMELQFQQIRPAFNIWATSYLFVSSNTAYYRFHKSFIKNRVCIGLCNTSYVKSHCSFS